MGWRRPEAARQRWRWVGAATATLAVLAAVWLAFAPYVEAELFVLQERLGVRPSPPSGIALNALPGPAKGTVVDGYWRVEAIGPGTWAIGEPEGSPDNYEYLLAGKDRALLIDAGSTARDIHPALETLTKLPVTVIPTHLHFDHTNGLRNFQSIMLIDLPETRGDVREGAVHLRRYEYMGWFLAQAPPVFRVTEWVKPDEWIDLGGRRVQVLWTPGHTATSISVWDPATKMLFTGDFLYPTSLYAFQPDSSLRAYEATGDRLLTLLPASTTIYGAHCCRNDAPVEAPWLSMNDLRDARDAVARVRAGQAKGQGFVLRRFPVNSRMTLLTMYPWANR